MAGLGLAFVRLGREWAGTLAESSQTVWAGLGADKKKKTEDGDLEEQRVRGQGRIACLTHQTLAKSLPSLLHSLFLFRDRR